MTDKRSLPETSLPSPHHHAIARTRLTDMAHLKTELMWAYEGEVRGVFTEQSDHLPGQSALMVLAGTVEVETAHGVARATAGQWILPHQGPRIQRLSEDNRIRSVHFQLYWPGGEPLFNWPVAFVFDAAAAPKLEKQTRLLIAMIERYMPEASKDLPWLRGDLLTHFRFQHGLDSWLCAYVETLIAAGVVPSRLAKVDPRILRAVALLDELPVGKPLDERLLTEETGLSASQLNRLFIQEFKLTPHHYFEERKLARAKELIQAGRFSIKQITFETGFGSLPAFSRWFKQQTGQSPRDFKHNEQV